MQIKLIATDMDGTLLNEHHLVSEENAAAIKAAQEKGITVVVATGRSYQEALHPLQNAGITCPMICVNGAEIRSEKGEILKSVPLDQRTYDEVEAILREADLYFELYTSIGTFINDREKALRTVADSIKSAFPDTSKETIFEAAERRFTAGEISFVPDYREVLNREGVEIYKLLVFSRDESRLLDASRKLAFLPDLAISSSGRNNMELTNQRAQKGLALQEFAARRGISLQETMAFGDNFNDLSMLTIVGIGVAMGNAVDEVKEACSFVADNNDQDGVAHAIKELVLMAK